MDFNGDQNLPARGVWPSRRQLGLGLASAALTLSSRSISWAATETFPTIKTKIPALSLLEQLEGAKERYCLRECHYGRSISGD